MTFDELAQSPAFLPGPARFLSGLIGDLRAGRSVVFQVPENLPPWVAAAIRRFVREDAELRWTSLSDDGTPPLEQLFAEFLPAFPRGEIRELPPLCGAEAFQGCVVCLENLDGPAWQRWRPLLENFADYSRRVDALERAQFLVLLPGDLPLPKEDVCLVNSCWRDACGPLDSRIHSALLVDAGVPVGTLRRDLIGSVAAELSLWDFDLCAELVRLPLGQLLDPFEFLCVYGRRAGFSGDTALAGSDLDQQWFHGTAQRFDGRWEQHSAYCALLGDRRTVEHRLWKAQVGVLLAFVELQRQELLKRCRAQLGLPFRDSGGDLVTDPFDVEIGLLSHRLNLAGNPPLGAVRYAQTLKEIRNALAHLEPVDAKTLSMEVLESPPW